MTKAEEARLKREARMQEELERVRAMACFEQDIVQRAGGHGPVCGIDEAGRGPLAGPVAAAAVILRRRARDGTGKHLPARQIVTAFMTSSPSPRTGPPSPANRRRAYGSWI